MENHFDLSNEFAKYFEIIPADTPQLRSAAYRLRFQVYCLENRMPGFDPSDFPDGEETDQYDDHALHALLFHRPSQTMAGTVRLVVHDASDPMWMFPIEEHAGLLAQSYQHPPRREAIAEISRFILSARFRCRRGEGAFPDGLVDMQTQPTDDPCERRHGPHPVLGLFKALVELSWGSGIAFWYAGMEPRLQRRLERFGVGLHLAAEGISYHGRVNAYLSSCAEIMRQCKGQCPEIWRFLTDNGKIWPIAPSFSPPLGRPISPLAQQLNGREEMKQPPPTKN